MPRYIVRHGVMRNLGVFAPRGRDSYARGDQIIARTSRGLESGEVLCEASDEAVATLKDPKQGQILRRLSGDDVRELRKMFEQERREYEVCQEQIKRLALQMKLVDVEHLYGGERVVVYYLSDERVDFRELVKSLATEFQTRIEMRQIGVRDEAKLLADYGDCGKPVCCNTHLSEMPPVSMKMAKLQRATLDPSKISGRCGRLKCCLRYEYETYQDLQRELPPVGADIITSKGRAHVLAQEILAGQVLVETEDMRRIVIDATDVLTVLKREKRPREAHPTPDTEEPAYESTAESLPPELAHLEDTNLPDDTSVEQSQTDLGDGAETDPINESP
ncbi:MAG TPA: regulatory iron-sulfur-containing complex subunit RicT [Lacipirellulaceae bacterium]|nr:regulatory iron-sulfur-containing complex subunit RicT [Lacipirellulaceae bacterium]